MSRRRGPGDPVSQGRAVPIEVGVLLLVVPALLMGVGACSKAFDEATGYRPAAPIVKPSYQHIDRINAAAPER
jgi:hypothetical protein